MYFVWMIHIEVLLDV